MPAPPATAPPVDSRAAPAYLSLPASRPSTPRRYLSDSAPGRGRRAAMSSACGALASGVESRYGPRPMSTSSTTPAWPLPGSISSPGLNAPNVTVTSARTAGPSTSPVSASMPLGRATARGGRGRRERRERPPQAALAADAEQPVDDEVRVPDRVPRVPPGVVAGAGVGPGVIGPPRRHDGDEPAACGP